MSVNRQMNHGSLFSGIGGFDLAAEWMGWNNVFHCEWNDFGKKILKHYWPNAISYDDITKSDFTIHRGNINIISGGFPCQPYSQAGKRRGKEDERHLWPEMLRAIQEIQPEWVLGENVRGIINWNGGLVFDEVQTDLEAAGYEVQPFLLPAAGVNAPHERYRTWFIAYTKSDGSNRIGHLRDSERTGNKEENGGGLRDKFINDGKVRITTNPNTGRFKECWPEWFTSKQPAQNYGLTSEPGICRGDDGFSYRVDRLKALGNAIVPQVVYQIFKAIAEYENLYNENPDCSK